MARENLVQSQVESYKDLKKKEKKKGTWCRLNTQYSKGTDQE